MNKTINLGIVGTGAAAKAHIQAFRNISGVNIVGIAGKDKIKVGQIANEYSIPKTYLSGEELIGSPHVNAVVLAVPPFEQPTLAVFAFQNSKSVLCEKPLGVRIQDVEKINMAWRKSGKIGMINFCYRLIPQFQELKFQMAAGKCGVIHSINAQWIMSNRLSRDLTYHWKGQKELGGGVLQNFGIHLIDFLFHDISNVNLLGAQQSTFIKTRMDDEGKKRRCTGDELTTALFVADKDMTIIINLSLVTRPQTGCSIVVQGDEGTMELKNMFPENPTGPFSVYYYRDNICNGECLSIGKKSSESALKQLFSRSANLFVKAIREKDCIYPNIGDGLRAEKILFNIQQKAA